MNCTILITRPGRAAALVATLGILFVARGAVALGGFDAAGAIATAVLVAAIATTIVGLGVLGPLHSRSGAAGIAIARIGLGLAFVPVLGTALVGWPFWLPLLVGALSVAAAGMGVLVFARRNEGDIPARLLELTFATTVIGVVLAPVGGSLVPGALWLALATALWSAYAAPISARLGEASASPAPG